MDEENTVNQEFDLRKNLDFTRLDNRSKLSLMAAVMYALSDSLTEEEAVEKSWRIDQLVGDKLRKEKLNKERILQAQRLRQTKTPVL